MDSKHEDSSVNGNSKNAPPRRLVSLNFRVPLELRKQLRMLAVERGVTMTCLLMEILEDLNKEQRVKNVSVTNAHARVHQESDDIPGKHVER
jgi:predicted DNA-binding protein